MAALSEFNSWTSHGIGHGDATGRPRPKPAKIVKPILKKLSSSAKGSLDLDRTWEQQNGLYHNQSSWDSSSGGGGAFSSSIDAAPASRSTKDLSITFDDVVSTTPSASCTGLAGTTVSGNLNNAGRRYHHHSRSISGTSHISVATSISSNNGGMPSLNRVGSGFVHPFQQIPRTATPPVSYANSLASFVGDARDYSPSTITEDEDDEFDPFAAGSDSRGRSSLNIARQPGQYTTQSYQCQPAGGLRRPSLVSHKTSSSLTETSGQAQPSLRINTSKPPSTTPANPSRLAHVSSKADLHSAVENDTPTSIAMASTYSFASPSSSTAPMSPLRSSFDAFDPGFPRLRAKSDLDTATRAAQVKAARRKFDEKERAKEEKYAREEIRRREKADNKRAQASEKKAAAVLKEQNAIRARLEAAEMEQALPKGNRHHRRKISTTSSGRNSLALTRPSMSRKSTSVDVTTENEKFVSNNYDAVDPQNPPAFVEKAGDFVIPPITRSHTAKKKTQGKWHMFILWLRTKLLRAGRT